MLHLQHLDAKRRSLFFFFFFFFFFSFLDRTLYLQHFDAMDHSAQQLSELDVSLGQATAFERYQEAAELKKKLDDLNGTDVVEEAMEV